MAKYPIKVSVKLDNAYIVLKAVQGAIREYLGKNTMLNTPEIIKEVENYTEEATNSDYDNLIKVSKNWVILN